MSLNLTIRFDMRSPDFGTPHSRLYEAAFEIATWADERGFDTLLFGEHHGMANGYTSDLSSPQRPFAALTRSMRICIRAAILPLHDPITIAEELATLDVLTDGRAEAVSLFHPALVS
jgi:alkanesulfonate monooxygenase SsuD/methylene tetrahydromethanopterin reductase-like flavin-dependent oxidoreductase (luciferase family)